MHCIQEPRAGADNRSNLPDNETGYEPIISLKQSIWGYAYDLDAMQIADIAIYPTRLCMTNNIIVKTTYCPLVMS